MLVGDRTFDGQKAWVIQQADSAVLAGKWHEIGREFTLNGTSTTSGASYISTAGAFLGRTTRNVTSYIVSAPAGRTMSSSSVTSTTRVVRVR